MAVNDRSWLRAWPVLLGVGGAHLALLAFLGIHGAATTLPGQRAVVTARFIVVESRQDTRPAEASDAAKRAPPARSRASPRQVAEVPPARLDGGATGGAIEAPPPTLESAKQTPLLPHSSEPPLDLSYRPEQNAGARVPGATLMDSQRRHETLGDRLAHSLKPEGRTTIENLPGGRVRVRAGNSCYEMVKSRASEIDPFSQQPTRHAVNCGA